MDLIEQQLDELELLQSVFSQPGEFTAEERNVEHARAWVKRLIPDAPKARLSCTLHLEVNRQLIRDEEDGYDCSDEEEIDDTERDTCEGEALGTVNISIILPHRYPDEHPNVFVSSDHLSRRGQDDLNHDLQQFKDGLPLGEVCLLTLAEWVRENSSFYWPVMQNLTQPLKLAREENNTHFSRLWLYMHHIYSKTKRRNILDLADQLLLTGFCLPGKPGVVCVEGQESSTREFFGILRRWNWKSITCRHREEEEMEGGSARDMSSWRRFDGFRELGLDTHGPRQNHMDMGQFRNFLEHHKLGHVFVLLFGVEG